MKIGIIGSWHLGSVYSNVLAQKGHEVLVFDPDVSVIENLIKGKAPLYEPGLDDLIKSNLEAKKIKFTHQAKDLGDLALLWVCFDTEIDENDNVDLEGFLNKLRPIFDAYTGKGNLVISSQLPIGTCRKISKDLKEKKINLKVVYSPENLRLGSSISYLMNPDRIVVGVEDEVQKREILSVFESITPQLLWMNLESAELTKHAINSFLALEVTFANELGVLAQHFHANPMDVAKGLKSDERIGPKAYLKAGLPFAGGTLARDLRILEEKFSQICWENSLPETALKSNQNQIQNLVKFINQNLDSEKTVTIIGLVYKNDTNTLRRSLGLDIGKLLFQRGVSVTAYDEILDAKAVIEPLVRVNTHKNTKVYLALNYFESFDNYLSEISESSIVIDLMGFYLKSESKIKGTYVSFENGKYVTK